MSCGVLPIDETMMTSDCEGEQVRARYFNAASATATRPAGSDSAVQLADVWDDVYGELLGGMPPEGVGRLHVRR